MAIARHQRRTGVEPHAILARHQRTVGEAGILLGILDHQQAVGFQNRVGTEGHIPCRLCHLNAAPGLEPLTLFIDQTDKRNRGIANFRCNAGDIVIRLLRQGIEYLKGSQRLQALRLMFG